MEKFCKYCGEKLNEGDKFCQKCGSKTEEIKEIEEVAKVENIEKNTIPTNNNVNSNTNTNTNNNVQNNDVDSVKGTNPSAIAGFVCSLVGLLIFGVIMGIIAICLGITAKKHIEVFKNEKGGGLATAAVIIGIIDVVFSIIGSIFNAMIF